jgi:hypothetical protein
MYRKDLFHNLCAFLPGNRNKLVYDWKVICDMADVHFR